MTKREDARGGLSGRAESGDFEMFDNIKQKFRLAQNAETNTQTHRRVIDPVEAMTEKASDDATAVQHDFDSIAARFAAADAVLDEHGDVENIDVLADIADDADIHQRRGVESDLSGRPNRVGRIVASGLRVVVTNDHEGVARELASFRQTLDEGAPDDLPSTGEKGMWKQGVRVKIQTLEWALGV